MKSRALRSNKSSNDERAAVDELLGTLYAQAQAQFGSAIKSFWFHDGSLCPGCAERATGAVKVNGTEAVSLNAFIYREPGVLIGYFLCEGCVAYILKEAQANPYRQTPLHANIERSLIAAYQCHLAGLDA